ncbi:MAG: M20 family metallo-hydrolase [Cyclobacteriaceae bacterium]
MAILESNNINAYYEDALILLQKLISTPSLSKEEDQTAKILEDFFDSKSINYHRKGNNIWAFNKFFDAKKPTILLNSHHDTVKPNKGYTKDPYEPQIAEGKLFGLGSNDAGGCLVSLILTFHHFYDKDMPYNLVMAATAEEENSGLGGVELILDEIGLIDFGIIGEPTEMKMGVAEKGLMVLDCYAQGKSGHAARDQGVNAIYEALTDIEWFRNYAFDKISNSLGAVKMSVTMISAGYQHNVVPDTCHFVVDVRTTDLYDNTTTLEIIKEHVKCRVEARSTRLNSSYLPENYPISKVADDLNIEKFGSPTTSDQAVIPYPTFKMGPGRSERSHTPDEFIFVKEIAQGIEGYINLLSNLFVSIK